MSTMTTGRWVATRGDQLLIDVEGPKAQLFEKPRINDLQGQQRQQKPHAENPRGSKSPSLTEKPFHADQPNPT